MYKAKIIIIDRDGSDEYQADIFKDNKYLTSTSLKFYNEKNLTSYLEKNYPDITIERDY